MVVAEATAAAQILVSAWPIAPQWLLALIFMIIFTAINLIGVKLFGEVETPTPDMAIEELKETKETLGKTP